MTERNFESTLLAIEMQSKGADIELGLSGSVTQTPESIRRLSSSVRWLVGGGEGGEQSMVHRSKIQS
ncbi:hypothetical protein J6590_104402, partial [Homalodisca vitripennis]